MSAEAYIQPAPTVMPTDGLKPFVATVKQGRTTHEVTGYAPTLDRAEEIILEAFSATLGRSNRYIGVRWAE